VKKSFENYQISEVQHVTLNNRQNLKVRQGGKQENFVLQKIHKFFAKVDALNLEYISRKW
jgi:hypothetical protein